ncbi:MAG: hypothetical protein JW928_05810 [Candidatus Aureabacteria bacterium]|nr:hypothetical protein [Candidatus Auribacterota bacterium]
MEKKIKEEEQKKKQFLNITWANVAIFVASLYFLLLIIGKYFLLLGDADMASRIFGLTLNKRGRVISLASRGDMEKAVKLAGENPLLTGCVSFSRQDFSASLESFKRAGYTEGIYYSLLGLGRKSEAKEMAEADSSLDKRLIGIREKKDFLKLLPELHRENNNLAIASLFLKIHDFPTASYYLKKESSSLSYAYFNLITQSHFPVPFSQDTDLSKKFDVFRFINSGNIGKARRISESLPYTEGQVLLSIMTGDWDQYFSLLRSPDSKKKAEQVSSLEEIFSPLPENKILLDKVIKENPNIWIQPSFSEALLTVPVISAYRVMEKTFHISLIISLGVFLIIFLRWAVQLKREKLRQELSVINAVQMFPQVQRQTGADTPSHSWNISNIDDVLENEFQIIKTAFDKLEVSYSEQELREKIRKVKIKNKAYKIYSISTQFNLYVKMVKTQIDKIQDFTRHGIVIFTFKDGSLQLFVSKEGEEYHLFDGKTRNQYNKESLNVLWDDQIITLKKMKQ